MTEPDLNHILKHQQEVEDKIMARFTAGENVLKKYKIGALAAQVYQNRTDFITGQDMVVLFLEELDKILPTMSRQELEDAFTYSMLGAFQQTIQTASVLGL